MAQLSLSGFAQPRNNPTVPAVLVSSREKVTLSPTAANGTINFDISTQSILYYTQDSTGSFVLNIRGNANNTLDSVLGIGNSISLAFMVANSSIGAYCTSVQIDGTVRTVKWQGGSAPATGNTNATDMYNLTIIKIGSNQYTIFAVLSRFTY